MELMRFKTFVWPENPHVYREVFSREGMYHKNDLGQDVFEGMGLKKCVITGSGVFFGENAHENFRRLSALFGESTPGDFYHPTWGVRSCFFTGLELTQEPAENCISYRFELQAADGSGVLPK